MPDYPEVRPVGFTPTPEVLQFAEPILPIVRDRLRASYAKHGPYLTPSKLACGALLEGLAEADKQGLTQPVRQALRLQPMPGRRPGEDPLVAAVATILADAGDLEESNLTRSYRASARLRFQAMTGPHGQDPKAWLNRPRPTSKANGDARCYHLRMMAEAGRDIDPDAALRFAIESVTRDATIAQACFEEVHGSVNPRAAVTLLFHLHGPLPSSPKPHLSGADVVTLLLGSLG